MIKFCFFYSFNGETPVNIDMPSSFGVNHFRAIDPENENVPLPLSRHHQSHLKHHNHQLKHHATIEQSSDAPAENIDPNTAVDPEAPSKTIPNHHQKKTFAETEPKNQESEVIEQVNKKFHHFFFFNKSK